MKNITIVSMKAIAILGLVAFIAYFGNETSYLEASSHREAPMLVEDPLADNTDLYAFRSPDNPNTVTIIANYIGLELPSGGPNYSFFSDEVRYEIHIKTNSASFGDDLLYRFTFTKVNEDPTTFFNIRLGKQNLKTMYKLERRFGNNGDFVTIVQNGIVPPNNIGPRSIENPTLGLGKTYEQLIQQAIMTSSAGNEKIYCGHADDPFFADLGGIFDLGQTRQAGGARDALGCLNVHTIALQIPIQSLQKDLKTVSQATSILDDNFIIGVWASSSRQRIRTLNNNGAKATMSGDWVQVSRLGMPLMNEVINPIGQKDKWNAGTPYEAESQYEQYLTNPELALYMDDRQFGAAVPALADLRIQTASKTLLGAVDFGNGKDGLSVLKGNAALAGTALDDAIFGNYLLRRGQPRSVDILPIFHSGVPNLRPYQLATGKTAGNPLTAGKPFINNFKPAYASAFDARDVRFGDMLRLNMAVPPTSRTDPKFSSEGLIAAAVLGLTDTAYNKSNALQLIPNMDGFPNGRRLEDDVTRIELQAVGGAVLAAIGLWYDDYVIGQSPLTPRLLKTLGYTTGVEKNDKAFKTSFPYVANPHSGFGICGGIAAGTVFPPNDLRGMNDPSVSSKLGIGAPLAVLKMGENPFQTQTTLAYRTTQDAQVSVMVYDLTGKMVKVLEDQNLSAGSYETKWNASGLPNGTYIVRILVDGKIAQTAKLTKAE